MCAISMSRLAKCLSFTNTIVVEITMFITRSLIKTTNLSLLCYYSFFLRRFRGLPHKVVYFLGDSLSSVIIAPTDLLLLLINPIYILFSLL